ncbi:MAG: hypothetical protein H6705_03820 [Myxococcales bacterium]|nr:hypothetical protein [Myxococcales bacterium]
MIAPAIATDDDDDDDDDAGEGPRQMVEELFAIELAFPQEAGEVQLTLAFDEAGGHNVEVLGLELEGEVGLTDFLQLSAAVPFAALLAPAPAEDAYGLGDVEVGVLAAFVPHPRLVLAAAVEVTLPTGDDERGLGEGEIGYGPSLRAALDAAGAQWHAFAGLELGDEIGVEYGLGVTVLVDDDWALSLEGLGEAEAECNCIEVVPGIVWRGMRALQVGVGVRLFAGDGTPSTGLSALAVTEF